MSFTKIVVVIGSEVVAKHSVGARQTGSGSGFWDGFHFGVEVEGVRVVVVVCGRKTRRLRSVERRENILKTTTASCVLTKTVKEFM